MNKYEAFIKVVELGSITKAANELNYSQPGISNMLKTFEAELGFPILHRNREALRPTAEGERILTYCYQYMEVERGMQETADAINGMMVGTIRIGAIRSTIAHFLPRLIHSFSNMYSQIELKLREYAITDLYSALQQGKCDIAFTSDDIPKGFDFHELFVDPICVCMHEDHPLASHEKIPIVALNGCDFIMPEEGWDDLVKLTMDVSSYAPNIRHYVASDTAGIELAAEGLGVYLLPRQLSHTLPPHTACREIEEPCCRRVGICARSFKNSTPAQKEFIKAAIRAGERFGAVAG